MIINVCAMGGSLCQTVILVQGNEQDSVRVGAVTVSSGRIQNSGTTFDSRLF